MTYAEELSEAWRAAFTPRSPRAPTVVSTFAGGGGSSLGYKMAGYRVLFAVEWDPFPAACYRLNFPSTPVFEGDVCTLSTDDVLRRTGLEVGELDVLDGSPPCQGFSTARGKREVDDPRNGLFREYVRLLRGLRPRAFVMENVAGMASGPMRKVFRAVMEELRGSGYRVECRRLDARWLGVPQGRVRLIFVGTRDDLPIVPSHPAPSSSEVSVEQALGYPLRMKVTAKGWHTGKVFVRPSKPCRTLLRSGIGAVFPDAVRTWRGEDTGPATVIPDPKGHMPSVGEAMRIGSFPDEYRWPDGAKWDRAWGVVGNSVPPLMMRAVADHVRRAILEKGPRVRRRAR